MKKAKEKKIRPYIVDGAYVLSKKKKVKTLGPDFCIASITSKDLERLAAYTKQRKEFFSKKHPKFEDLFVVRLSSDLVFFIDDRRKK